jgi:hypothetical protein
MNNLKDENVKFFVENISLKNEIEKERDINKNIMRK